MRKTYIGRELSRRILRLNVIKRTNNIIYIPVRYKARIKLYIF